MRTPLILYRPTRTKIAGGRFLEVLPADGREIWGIFGAHDLEIWVTIDGEEDVRLGDIIETDEELGI